MMDVMEEILELLIGGFIKMELLTKLVRLIEDLGMIMESVVQIKLNVKIVKKMDNVMQSKIQKLIQLDNLELSLAKNKL
jgi:hypothetical protein